MKRVKATAAGMVLSAISFGIFSAESEQPANQESAQTADSAPETTVDNVASSTMASQAISPRVIKPQA
ncbi:hypothetical protein GWD52_09865 [Enterobacteriaceae bacterium 4M9]|nr:hypothetical protein [Enterobacteriaceae bacterium 4M9]